MKKEHLTRTNIANILILADKELDGILAEGEKVELLLLGSAPLILLGMLDRATEDIDAYSIKNAKVREALGRFGINDRGGPILNVFEDFEDRLETVPIPLNRIVLKVMGPYDMIIAKMGTPRKKDLDDIIESGLLQKIDFDKLEQLIKEKLAACVNEMRIWEDFQYLKENKERG